MTHYRMRIHPKVNGFSHMNLEDIPSHQAMIHQPGFFKMLIKDGVFHGGFGEGSGVGSHPHTGE